MQREYLVQVTLAHLAPRKAYATPSECHRQFTTDQNQAQRYASRRDAFAAAMTLESMRLLPRNAFAEVVPMVQS